MYIKIGQIKLFSDIKIKEVKKRDYVILVIGKKNDLKSLHRRFFQLKNHYLKCIIKHEMLEYTGFMQICGVSDDFVSDLGVKLSFEP